MPDPNPNEYVTHSEFSTFASATNDSFRRIEVKLDSVMLGRTTNWGWVVGAVGLLGAIIALYVQPVSAKLDKHISLDGHPRALQMHERTNEQVQQNDKDIADSVNAIHALEQEVVSIGKQLASINSNRFNAADAGELRAELIRLIDANTTRKPEGE